VRKKLRVLVLMHRSLLPPDDPKALEPAAFERLKTEYDVVQAVRALGHDVQQLGVHDELRPIRDIAEGFQPHVVFNLMEEFHGDYLYDYHVAAYLELLKLHYTGCNPRGLVLARDKALSKSVASYHRIRAPRFAVIRRGRRARPPTRMRFPLIVKSLVAEASLGIAKASLVHDDEKLAERVSFIHDRLQTDAIAEEFIAGREVYVGLLGNERLVALPPRELVIGSLGPGEELIATDRAKHDVRYQKERGIEQVPADLPPELKAKLLRQSKRICHLLHLDGYVRVDWRIREDGEPFFLEANPNPEIAHDEEFASSAAAAEIPYEKMIQRILNLGLTRAPVGG
jgi:D-alanine-D-alanine ligase